MIGGATLIALAMLALQGPSIHSYVDTTRVSVGGRVILSVTVDHASNESVRWPEFEQGLGSFEVTGMQAAPSVPLDGRVTSSARYMLTAFELGDLEIPPLEVTVVGAAEGPNGNDVTILETDPLGVVVESVGRDETGDIRDIKGPVDMARNWWLLLPWLLGLLLLGAVAWWAYRRYKANQLRSTEGAMPAIPPQPAHDIAYKALNELEASPLLEGGEIKRYFTEASSIIRVYLDGRYGIDATDMISADIVAQFTERCNDPLAHDRLVDVLERSDLVKFAKYRPQRPACAEMIPVAREIVDRTRVHSELPAPGEDVTADVGDVHVDSNVAGVS